VKSTLMKAVSLSSRWNTRWISLKPIYKWGLHDISISLDLDVSSVVYTNLSQKEKLQVRSWFLHKKEPTSLAQNFKVS